MSKVFVSKNRAVRGRERRGGVKGLRSWIREMSCARGREVGNASGDRKRERDGGSCAAGGRYS